jgi:transcriptional regulator with XRE-family HTH domain
MLNQSNKPGAAVGEKPTFGPLLRQRRRDLGLTQRELAFRLGVKAAHIAYLEANRRRPSLSLLSRLVKELGLKEELFRLAHPEAYQLINIERQSAQFNGTRNAWLRLIADKAFLARHAIKPPELRVLSRVNLLGEIKTRLDYLFVLNSIRQAIKEE